MSEAGSGSDVMSMKLTADKQGMYLLLYLAYSVEQLHEQ